MRRLLLGVLGSALALSACTAPYDGDGEILLGGGRAAPPPSLDAVPVVVDTDLGGDDLAALVFLLRHPAVEVEAITVAGAGLVGCDPGVDNVADLLTTLGERAVPVACTTRASEATAFPDEWRAAAATGTGKPRPGSTLTADPGGAASLVAHLARRHEGLVLVALGPMTTAAELARRRPARSHDSPVCTRWEARSPGSRSTASPSGTRPRTPPRSRRSSTPASR